ncbi:unnamed protein product [Musa acuminata subsp. malaccensis]|uniref:(wild Malaysian banana) hypothetical protein n=1 Tax=Musa acuminata subsp. malaccensis TaxID=214687 RepID=A0A804JN55_MUSAM|nr:PREDICTED: myb-related protein Zm1-like [Musa acuminata subsp. malaccensis]CAG1848147.1 unnamed protein product [Musa acuminata subsp. malaccensis]
MGRGRAPCCDKVGLNKGTWTSEEDTKLVAFIHKHGRGNWRALPKQAGLLRCGKSCRLRWINYLRPDIKRGNFTEEEVETIIRLQRQLGNRWSKIASCLPGRTDNEIKNLWNTHLKRRLGGEQTGSSRAHSSCGKVGDEQDHKQESINESSSSSSCISSSESHVAPRVTCSGPHDETKNRFIQDYSIELQVWGGVMDEFSFFVPPYVGPMAEGVHRSTATTSEEKATREIEDDGWLAYLEEELQL